MTQTHLLEHKLESSTIIRNEPVQARSAARLTALLDAAAAVIDEIGYERLTTAMVAERAGASIGTVYRYFPDRIAVLQSLAARNAERLISAVAAAVEDEQHSAWGSAGDAGFEVYVSFFRNEAGFASLRLGDVLDLRPAEGTPANTLFADRLFEVIVSRFGVDDSADARFALEAAIEVNDALVARAFARDADGYTPFLEKAREASAALVAPFWGARD